MQGKQKTDKRHRGILDAPLQPRACLLSDPIRLRGGGPFSLAAKLSFVLDSKPCKLASFFNL
jgi:hypothetical protein